MSRKRMEEFKPLEIFNPNKAWVVKELDKLLDEWNSWNEIAKSLVGAPDSPDYKPESCAESIKDGWDNIRKHEILREKTLVFLRNHFVGAEFLFENWPHHPHENNIARLNRKVATWIQRLEVLKASIDYARVPDSFWKEKGKELVNIISKTAPEKAVEVAASYLKNPV